MSRHWLIINIDIKLPLEKLYRLLPAYLSILPVCRSFGANVAVVSLLDTVGISPFTLNGKPPPQVHVLNINL